MWDVLQEAVGELQDDKCEMTCLEMDIFGDEHALEYLRIENCNEQWNRKERKRVMQREACGYMFRGETLYRGDKIVPHPTERTLVIIRIHEDLGHMGVTQVLEGMQ